MGTQPEKKTFLGFGLGAVQSGLMLYEAYKSGNFRRFVVLEVNEQLVREVRNNRCTITINTATKSGIVKSQIEGLEVYNPNDVRDRPRIASAIQDADELATALPSTDFYDAGEFSPARLLAGNINSDKQQIIYTAENNNYAAEILSDLLKKCTDGRRLGQFQALNTVIGKMGGVIRDDTTVRELKLDRVTPASQYAVLVEEFNSIIVSRVKLPGYRRGIEVFQEQDDLLPFEEAKLFGHNAVHSMLGYFAALRNYRFMSDIRDDRELSAYGIRAFKDESGAFLLRKYATFGNPLFTGDGFDFYATDLLERMTNPYLRDEVQRICRDPVRKLESDDRFFGTIREALKQNVHPTIIPKAVLAALCYIVRNKIDTGFSYPHSVEDLNEHSVRTMIVGLWKENQPDRFLGECLDLVVAQLREFREEFID